MLLLGFVYIDSMQMFVMIRNRMDDSMNFHVSIISVSYRIRGNEARVHRNR